MSNKKKFVLLRKDELEKEIIKLSTELEKLTYAKENNLYLRKENCSNCYGAGFTYGGNYGMDYRKCSKCQKTTNL